MTINEIATRLERDKCLRKQGRSTVAKRLHCSVEEVDKARKILKNNNRPKILIFDIETAPMRAYVWGRWNQNVSLSETISEWFMLCWSAKWLGRDDVISEKLTAEEALREDDYRIAMSLWELINEADIVVAYNGKKADIKWMNTRFIVHSIPPPSSYIVIDPCEVARKVFGFSSNKLDALAGYFNIEHKMETNFELWDKALRGSQEALDYMSLYCGKDVEILEKVYLKLRPWDKKHFNYSSFINEDCCPICGGTIEKIEKKYITSSSIFSLYRCKSCGAISRGNKGSKSNSSIKICSH